MTAEPASAVMAPTSEDDAVAVVRRAVSKQRPLRILGNGTRSGLGRPAAASEAISAGKLAGISLYEPSELVIGAKTGTTVSQLQAALDENGQMLAFEPIDHRTIFGTNGEPTIGGIVGVNASGPRRIRVGAARDALLGVRFVNGKGELIKAGGRVMKNVTGLDLTKAICGAFGTLGFVTEATFKLLPKPERSATLLLSGLADADAIAALSSALGSPYEPTGAAHLPQGLSGDTAQTIIRIEGFSESVDHRADALADRLRQWSAAELVDDPQSAELWRSVRDAAPVAEPREQAIWRISVKPGDGPDVAARIGGSITGARWFFDWGGGLIWVAVPSDNDAGAGVVRSAVVNGGGHATLIRVPDEFRGNIPAFQPLSEPLMRLTAGIKRSFDPDGLFEPGRM